MKLPPAALTAPSLCPRCDAPAIMTDFCIQCSLQLRHCGACLGVAGPFDRFCGFCGHELLLGSKRSPVWRLWLLIALIPLAAGIGFGVSPLSSTAVGAVGRIVAATAPAPGAAAKRSPGLGIGYTLPSGWLATDASVAPGAGALPLVVAARNQGDVSRVIDARGDPFAFRPGGPVAAFGRPVFDPGAASPAEPGTVLALQVGSLVAGPPPLTKVEVARPISAITVSGRPGAEVVLKLTRDSGVLYLHRALIYQPQPTGPPLVRFDALLPAADWDLGADKDATAILKTLRLS